MNVRGGRKSIIMKKNEMGRSGKLARMIMLLASDTKLDVHNEDCHTLHPVKLEIKSGKHLAKLKGRYYRLPHSRTYTVLDGTEDQLIGKTIFVRSPITCASEKVCKMCYGNLSYTNNDIESIGGYAGTKLTEPLSQSILSSKHLLTTNSDKIEFGGRFSDFFVLRANEIILNGTNDEIDFNNYSLLIIKKNIISIEEFDDNEFNSFVTIFHVVNKKTGEIYDMRDKNNTDMYISPELKALMKNKRKKKRRGKQPDKIVSDEYIEVNLGDIEDNERIFVMEINNNGLTKPLYDIIHLLDVESRRGEYTTINKVAQRMLDLMIQSKMKVDSVHAELIIRPLIRVATNILDRPDFRKYDIDYVILTIGSALQNNPSILISLSYSLLNRQLVNPLTFKKKAESFIDPFFKETP